MIMIVIASMIKHSDASFHSGTFTKHNIICIKLRFKYFM